MRSFMRLSLDVEKLLPFECLNINEFAVMKHMHIFIMSFDKQDL